MLPDSVLSTIAAPDVFLAPLNRLKEPLIDYEMGGAALNDASQGMQVQIWRARYIDDEIVLDVPGVVAPQAVLAVADVTGFCLTFDQNMQPAIAYVVGDESAHFYWFDATVPEFVTLDLPAGTITPRCSLDDKRQVQVATSDIILTYMRDGTLYFRAQRERYEQEHTLATDLDNFQLGQFGMSRGLRMQWQLVPVPLEDS